jgi:alpha-galactosidase
MIMWHYGEPVELAAFQLLNVMFSVPQVSVRLQEIPKDHAEMVRFYTDYWRRNRAVLLDGAFEALSPNANYPVVRASGGGKQIVGLYADAVVGLDGGGLDAIDVLNAKNSRRVVLDVARDLGRYRYTVRDSQGRTVDAGEVPLTAGPRVFTLPVSGLLGLERIAARR